MTIRSGIAPAVLALATLALLLGNSAADAQTAYSYSGRAFGVQVHTTLPNPNTVRFADTGELSPDGGSLSASLASVSVASVQTGAVTCNTQGSGGTASSVATVLDLSAYAGTPASISATQVQARADVTCGSAKVATTISGLVVGGLSVVVTGAANQTLAIPGVGTLVINEQIHAGPSDVTVNALHLTLATGDELIVCSAHSDIACVTPSRPSSWGEVKRRFH